MSDTQPIEASADREMWQMKVITDEDRKRLAKLSTPKPIPTAKQTATDRQQLQKLNGLWATLQAIEKKDSHGN